MNYNWKKWKVGCVVSLFMSLLVAGAGYEAGMSLQAFLVVFCAAAVTHFGAFLHEHPVDQIDFNEQEHSKNN